MLPLWLISNLELNVLGTVSMSISWVMPSPSASSKFVLSVLKFLGILKFLSYTQNILGVLKWANLCSKI